MTPTPTSVPRPRWDAPATGLTFDAASFTLRRMAPASRWYAGRSVYRLSSSCTCDPQGVPVRMVAGRATYHPTNVADHALWLIDSFRQTGERAYLDRAIRDAVRLREEADVIGGALFYPYRFDFATGPWRLDAPWYSAMAQGEVLSVMVALDEITHQARFRTWADQTFAAFTLGRRAGRPWVAYADISRHLWLEEYPVMPAGHVLNGMIFGVLGIADYASLTGDATARRFAAGAMTTLRRLADDYRRPGRNSAYYLDGPSTSDHYHAVVIWQLRYLERLTGDTAFGALADRFVADSRVASYRSQPTGSGGWPAVPDPTPAASSTPAATPTPPTPTTAPTSTPPSTPTPTSTVTPSPSPSPSPDPPPSESPSPG